MLLGGLVQGLERLPNWKVVFADEWHKLFVDTDTSAGGQLYEGLRKGTTTYRNEFHRSLALGCNLLRSRDEQERREGFAHAAHAFQLKPSAITIQEILLATHTREFRQQAAELSERYVQEFLKNKQALARQDGYEHQVVSALLAAEYLKDYYASPQTLSSAQFYQTTLRALVVEVAMLRKSVRW